MTDSLSTDSIVSNCRRWQCSENNIVRQKTYFESVRFRSDSAVLNRCRRRLPLLQGSVKIPHLNVVRSRATSTARSRTWCWLVCDLPAVSSHVSRPPINIGEST